MTPASNRENPIYSRFRYVTLCGQISPAPLSTPRSTLTPATPRRRVAERRRVHCAALDTPHLPEAGI